MMNKNLVFSILCFLTFIPFLDGMPFTIDIAPLGIIVFILHVGAIGLVWRTFDRAAKISGYLSIAVLALFFMLYCSAVLISEKSLTIPKLFLPMILIQGAIVIWCLVYFLEKILKLRINNIK